MRTLALLGAPMAWAGQLVFGSEIEEVGCHPPPVDGVVWGLQTTAWIAIVSVVAAAVAATGLTAAVRLRHRARQAAGASDSGASEFLARAGILSSSLFLALIVMGSALLLAFGPCEGVP